MSGADYKHQVEQIIKKIVRGQDPEKNEQYRSHVGAMNWLTMSLRSHTPRRNCRGSYKNPRKQQMKSCDERSITQSRPKILTFNSITTTCWIISHQRQGENLQIRKKQLMTRNTTSKMGFHKLMINSKSRITITQNPISPKYASPILTRQAKLKPDKGQVD